jgi:hypothetical protein
MIMWIKLHETRRERAMSLVVFTLILVTASTRVQADTGTCGGASVTLPFTDVPAANVFFCSIAAAYYSGLTNGTSATTYSPSANVTRDQMAAFITRTQDSALKRGSHRAALDQWAIPTSVPSTGRTAVGTSPKFVKSDGEDLWVANDDSTGTVSRVHASDGRLLGTWTGAFGASGVVIARGRVFVTSTDFPGRIYVIDPTQPPGAATSLTSSFISEPLAITFDGFNLWTAETGLSISKVNPNSGAVTTYSGFNSPSGIIYDGQNIWVAIETDGQLKKIDKATGAVLQTVTVGTTPQFPIFDGVNIWVPNLGSNSVTVVRASTGTVLATLTGNNLSAPFQAAFDGERVLVTNTGNASVSLWKASDLTPLGFATGATSVFGACSDGLNFWLTVDDGPPGHLVRF